MSETFVLVTGACHGGWAWRPVAAELRAAGHQVHTPTLAGLGADDDPRGVTLTDCVNSLVDYVERAGLTDITLLGHSWGGFVLTGAAAKLEARIRRLVFWNAFVPNDGESLIDACPPHYGEMFLGVAAASGNDTVTFPFEVFQQAFMQDASEETQRLIHSLLVPQPLGTFTEKADTTAFAALDIPTAYILCTEDLALPGEWAWADRFLPRLKNPLVIETPGSHEALFTRPAELADAFIRACATQ
ncbi:alpha/beta hydrolase [Streptomyces sp. NBC_01352]|uniref:Alpha/beta hydrolase n=1 Tax=Streptomyces plumbiresistens TaxID=511811 RepID=A0ABP7TNX8_9ACTN|nr:MULTISPECIES: alpha/beta fold hydrolase [unclassified Streptomyces]MCX4703810.1 alpha/beta hydrolase [Streptomyces sp. NBC_01373]